MAGPPKKKAAEERNDDSSSGDESTPDSFSGQQEIQADFEGRMLEAHDFHGIKQLLQQLFLKAHVNLSEITDVLIAETGIGSVLKQSCDDDEDDDDDMSGPLDVFGVTTVLNVSAHKESPCVKQLVSLVGELSAQHADDVVNAEITNILANSKRIGLLINERFVNIPPKIADPLLSSLLDEIERKKVKDKSFDFEYLILICKEHKPKGGQGDTMLVNEEEQIFIKEAKVSFEFDVQNESDTSVSGKWKEGDAEMIPHRKILFIPGNKFGDIVQQIKQLVN